MFSKKIIINLEKKDDIIHLEPLSDVHVGHVGFDEEHYLRRLKAIFDSPYHFTLFGGDQIDAINIYDKRFNIDTSIIPDIDDQKEKFLRLSDSIFSAHKSLCVPTKVKVKFIDRLTGEVKFNEVTRYVLKKGENPKIWGLLHGNHEYKIREITRAYLENNLCYPFGIDFLGAKAYLLLEVRHKNKILGNWKIMVMHGSGGAMPETMLKQMKSNNYMDVFLCGHLHQKYFKEEEVMDIDERIGKVWARPIYLGNMGTFCHFMTEGVSGYGDTKNKVEGTPIGTITLSFNAYQGKVTGHI